MAIPVQFQQFKSAGIYRVVYDKSTVLGTDAELLRLVVGYSPKGPFNTPVYVKSVSDFKALFGNISKTLEKRGCFFHRTCIHALEAGPILCLNLKPFDSETTSKLSIDDTFTESNVPVKDLFDTTRFWKLEPSKLNDDAYFNIAATDSIENSTSVIIRKPADNKVKDYAISVLEWFNSYNMDIPEYLVGHEDELMSSFFTEVYVFKGQFTTETIEAGNLSKYFETDNSVGSIDYNYMSSPSWSPDENGENLVVKDTIQNAFGKDIDGLDALFNDPASGALAHYIGCLLPEFVDPNLGYISIDVIMNEDSDTTHLMASLNENLLQNGGENNITTITGNYACTNKINTLLYIPGYNYSNNKPTSLSIKDKLDWQNSFLDVIINESGLREGLISQAEIDYRYIVDSFETYPSFGVSIKNKLSYIAKLKELCFAILNYPSVRTIIQSTTGNPMHDMNGVFDAEKATKFVTLPSETDGASFCAFYTPLKFSDGYIDSVVPSAGLVSNLFITKYANRQPYSIVAGPNYGNIRYGQLVGPDYNYSQEELHIMEPYGVNCMVYRPTFGTFINANQTAKQTPKSALSSINVRELVIYLQTEIGKILQSYQWEFNNPTTRSAIKTKADSICSNAKANGGIKEFLNIMDESNNTPDIIDNEMCVISTHIEPGRGMGKMIHELTIYRTGGMSSMIKEG